jgi:hypothetical protein
MRVIVLTKDARLTDLPEDRYREIWEDGIDRGDPVKIERLRAAGINPADLIQQAQAEAAALRQAGQNEAAKLRQAGEHAGADALLAQAETDAVDVVAKTMGKINYSLTRFVSDVLESEYNKSLWSQWLKSMDDPKAKRVTLNVGMKDELRRLVGLDPLPVQVVDAFDDVDPDAEIVEIIGDDTNGTTYRVIKLKTRAPVNIACNGTVRVLDTGNDVQSRVTPLTLRENKAQSCDDPRKSTRKPGWVTTSRATVEQNDRRDALGKTWQEVYEAGLKALEDQTGERVNEDGQE